MSAFTTEPAPAPVTQLRRTRVAGALLGAIALLFAWWGWKQGAFFGPVFYPGGFAVFALLGLLLVAAPLGLRLVGPVRIAAAASSGLAAWIALSALWSPLPAVALLYAEHAALYAALFVIGLWVTNLLGARMLLALTPLALAGAVLGIATVVVLATGTDVTWYLQGDATLRFPLGYRNANAAFFLICLWPLLMLATESDWRWQLRALSIGAATVLVELELLTQSRGSAPALAAALLVYLAFAPHRLRAAVVIALATLPALPALPVLLEVYRHGGPDAGAIPLLRDAARAIGLTTALSLLIAAVALRGVAPRLRLKERTVTWLSRGVAAAAILFLLVGGSVFVARHGGPVGFVDQRVAQFNRVGYPNLHNQGIRFGANVGSNRSDFWRVAGRQGLDHPLLGGGGGSFQIAYLEHRRSGESPQDPHSAEMLLFSELGFPGLLLFGAFVVSAAMAGWRSWRLGPTAAALVAGSLAAAAQWLVHGSFDWLWNYPGVTGPAIFALGAAAAPALLDPATRRAPLLLRSVAVVALAAVALLALPLYLSSRYAQRAYGESAANPRAAIADLDRAARLNPLDAKPLLVKGEIESGLGERGKAMEAWRQAIGREPENYAAYYFMARELVGVNPSAARTRLQRALALDPHDRALQSLQGRLEGAATQR
jgi:O-Antigen ligase